MNAGNVTTQASMTTRVKVWFDSLPFVTRAVFVVCVAIYLVGAFIGFDSYGLICLSADKVLWQGQVWRFVTGAVFHMGALHVAFNMLAFVPIGASLERNLGSVAFGHLILLLIVLGDASYVFFSFIAAYGPARKLELCHLQSRLGGEWVRQCAVGLSGVVFGLIVADNAASAATRRSIFGFFSVPAAAYPWALLVLWQLVMPGASFLGHLCGVLVGQLYVWGLLKWLLLPPAAIRWLECCRLCGPIYNQGSFIALAGAGGSGPQLPVSFNPPQASGSSGGQGQEQRGSWFSNGWMRLPASNPAGQHGAVAGSGLFGLGGGSGTAGATSAPFRGQSRTIGAPAGSAGAATGYGTTLMPPPAYAANARTMGGGSPVAKTSHSAAPAHLPGGIPDSGSRQPAGVSTSAAAGGNGSSGGGGRKLDPSASTQPNVAARSAAAAAAEARAVRFQRGQQPGNVSAEAAGMPHSGSPAGGHASSGSSAGGGSSRLVSGPDGSKQQRPSAGGRDSASHHTGNSAVAHAASPLYDPALQQQPSDPQMQSAADGGATVSAAAEQDETLAQLQIMGFPRHAAVAALKEAEGDIGRALDFLSGNH